MFRINEVVRFESALYRILAFYQNEVVWIMIDEVSVLPLLIPKTALIEAIEDESLTREKDPFAYLAYEVPSEGSVARRKRDQAFQLIQPLVENQYFFLPKVRGDFINKTVSETKTTKQTLYRLLRRYWQRGQTVNALLPDYRNSGGRGKKRKGSDKKLGRPRKYQSGTGAVINESTERLFRRVLEKYVLKKKNKRTLSYAYRKFETLFQTCFPDVPAQEMPSIWQMKHFYKREYGIAEKIEKKTSAIDYNKDYRPLHGTATKGVLGPGARYEIDATIADIYLVSDSDRGNVVGRPTIYMVIDVFSRMVAGFYIGFENPSYVAAIQALIMAMTDKVAFCKRFGIKIDYEDWPVVGLPDAILADRGELLGYQIETLECGFSVRIENTPPYRGDAKGIVERSFKTIQAEFKPFAPGVVQGTTVKKRGGKDYRLDACLTVHEFTEIILASVLYRNRYHPLEKYDRSIDMPVDMPMTPLSIWTWGVQNRTGHLRSVSEDALRIGILPRTKATVSSFGVCVFGLYYTSKELLQSGWLHRSKEVKRPVGMQAAYDPCDAEAVYLFPRNQSNEYWVCRLATRSRQFVGASFWDVWQVTAGQKVAIANGKLEAGENRRKLDDFIESKISAAKKMRPTQGGESDSSRIRGIRDNRRQEKEKERKVLADYQKKSDKGTVAKVIPLSEPQEDYGYPDMINELFDEDSE